MEGQRNERPVVLITGGSRGIGAATARRFAQGGWNIALNYCRAEQQACRLAEELRGFGAAVAVIQADVSQSEQAAHLVAQTAEQLGGLDALVCNAGIAGQQMLLTDVKNEAWQQMMDTNLSGVFYTMRAAVPQFVRQQRGAVVTVSSMWGLTGGSCEAAYSASKAGVIGLTRAMAKELGPSHVRVNCVAPGVIDTDMNGHLSEEDLDALAEETPLGRIGQPEEVADGIFFLASDQASFITGQVLAIDGGMVI